MSEITSMEPADIGNIIKKLQSSTASVVKISNQMPLIGDGFELYATFPQFNQFMHTQRNRIINVLRRISSEVGLKSLKINDRSLDDITQLVSVNDRLVDNIVRIFDEHESKLNEDRVNVRKIDLGAECVSGATATSSNGITHIPSRIVKRIHCVKQAIVTVPKQSNDYKELLNGRQLNNRQIFALEQLWRWREVTAKEHDKSFYYVLPDHMMLKIAEVLPREQSGILACCTPVPRLVRHELESLTRILKIARELPLEQTTINNLNNLSKQNGIDELIKLDNCVNGLKAKLEYRFDISKYLNNENEEKNKKFLANKGLEIFNKNKLKEKNEEKINNESKGLRQILLSGNMEKFKNKESNSCKEKAFNIHEYFEQQWASPYETYLVAVMENKEIKNEKIFIQKQTTIQNKRSYSHLDLNKEEEEDIQIIEEKKIKIENKINKEQIIGLNDDEEEIEEERKFFADPSNLTKKAKKKLRQKLRKSADIQLN
ncbi:hypothetical protein ACQ4LE_004485 [Meloidogyne hapla]|uniref:HRDC domain-containing protein n=1 Tax=Meloidogyne hapla TaxID=6305 RepID=A0A1I8B4H0_MELHA